jgi:DNA-binding PadR family transcriptional regulator
MLSRAEEIILLTVFKLEGNAYGVTIREQVYKDIGRHWSFGVVYKTLKKMKAKGYVKKISSSPIAERGGRSRYYYEITPQGISVLKEIRRIQSSIWDGVQKLSLEEKVE